MPTTRREFLAKAAKIAAVAPIALPILQACVPTSAPFAPQSSNTVPIGSDGTVTVDVSDLSASHPFKIAPGVVGPDGFGVAVTFDGTQYHAFSQRCTHASCPVDPSLAGGNIHCSCHNSTFSLTGQVLSGPAPAPLQQYPVTLNSSSNSLKIKLA